MIETMIVLGVLGRALRKNRWYVAGGVSLFMAVETLARALGWT